MTKRINNGLQDITQKTKDRATRTPLSSCSTCGARRVTLVTKSTIWTIGTRGCRYQVSKVIYKYILIFSPDIHSWQFFDCTNIINFLLASLKQSQQKRCMLRPLRNNITLFQWLIKMAVIGNSSFQQVKHRKKRKKKERKT